jgi:hypothetical protein
LEANRIKSANIITCAQLTAREREETKPGRAQMPVCTVQKQTAKIEVSSNGGNTKHHTIQQIKPSSMYQFYNLSVLKFFCI